MIEGDLALCEQIGSYLANKGGSFYLHHTVEGALRNVQEIRPDLMMVALRLPDGNGLHLCRLLRENEKLKDLPIVLLTAHDYPVEKEKAIAIGVTYVIQKSADTRQLTARIEEILRNEIGITFWGVRGSVPCPDKEFAHFGGNTTCVQIHLPDRKQMLILDAGTGIRKLGNTLAEEAEPVSGRIFITHPHLDHIQGFPFFKPLFSERNSFEVYMPRQVAGSIREVLIDHLSYTYSPLTSRMFAARVDYHSIDRDVQSFEGYRVHAAAARHPVETAIYKFEIGRKKIVFCPDNELGAPEEDRISGGHAASLRQFDAFVSGADVLIHNAHFGLEDYPVMENQGHSAWELVVERAMKNGVKHLILTHFGPGFRDVHLEKVDEAVQKMTGDSPMQAELAREGQTFGLAG